MRIPERNERQPDMTDAFVYDPPRVPWLAVLHVDRDMIVVDKPSGLLSVPGRDPRLHDSVFSRVLAEHPLARDVHRLDLDTSGVFVVALRGKAQRELQRQFRERLVEKVYVARVWGHVREPQGIIDLPLAPDGKEPPTHKVCPTGRQARTRYVVLEQGAETALVRLEPLTGRSHQLRVHMLAIGHPILGDRFYAPEPVRDLAPRLLLHAERLALDHPHRGDRMVFEAPRPF